MGLDGSFARLVLGASRRELRLTLILRFLVEAERSLLVEPSGGAFREMSEFNPLWSGERQDCNRVVAEASGGSIGAICEVGIGRRRRHGGERRVCAGEETIYEVQCSNRINAGEYK
jgi:hypothetical protein